MEEILREMERRGVFSGPLGDHYNYRTYIALENYMDFRDFECALKEKAEAKSPEKYKELRLFLNALESFNNILDYYFYDYEEELAPMKLNEFRRKATSKHPVLRNVADLANACKHRVRENRKGKNPVLPWAKDLQKNKVDIAICLSTGLDYPVDVNVDYKFSGPLEEHRNILQKAAGFWIAYDRDRTVLVDEFTPST